ncbi:YslB family protein [Jeotgalibacillus campisalis]|uniref:DUF2507 domain-containing protein n=1 Tax=Jeotgalibacillus campisalis TaxID=220754 RepID=A0A0C2RWV5_9BACL|nr:YslB family protein [Jeotgalibacillus campisalis]KIL46254.1 hypothetical protein KR50_29290 [Jeotgalibacillus campisalis]
MSEENEITTGSFGYSLIRDELLPELLGNHTNEILYWAGKSLARRHPCQNEGELIHFFEKADWGTLELTKQKNDEMLLELGGPLLKQRIQKNNAQHFTLEAGFLAEQFAMMKQCQTEAISQRQKNNAIIQFTLKWDAKDPYGMPLRKNK